MATSGRGNGRDIGAHSVGGGRRRKRPGWLLPLLALLALLALIALLIGTCSGDDDEGDTARTPAATETEPAPQPEPATPAPSDDADGAGGAQAPAGEGDGGGTLTAGTTDVLAAQTADEAAVGEQAQGRDLQVVEVIEDEGFFVAPGPDDTNRTYVEFGGDVGADEQGFTPQVGDTVDLEAEVRPAPEDPAQTLNLDAEDAETVSSKGFFVNATSVERAGG
jgi:hypothetical protein